MRLDHFVALEPGIECFFSFGIEPLAACGDEGGDGTTEGCRLDYDGMSANDAIALEACDPVGNGWPGKADAVSNLLRRSASVAEKVSQDLEVESIQIGGHR